MMAYALIRANAPFLPYAVDFLTVEKTRTAILKRGGDRKLTDFWEHMTKQSGYNTIIESSRNKLNALAMNSPASGCAQSATRSRLASSRNG